MLPQVKKLLILFTVFISLFLLVRYFLKPDSFGEKGFYRAHSLIENEQFPLTYAGSTSCESCHPEQVENLVTDLHDVMSCETCHGPAMTHINQPDSIKLTHPTDRAFCASCHGNHSARSTDLINQVDIASHNINNRCIDCHNPHMPWDLKEVAQAEDDL